MALAVEPAAQELVVLAQVVLAQVAVAREQVLVAQLPEAAQAEREPAAAASAT